jgi:hypothetical protein
VPLVLFSVNEAVLGALADFVLLAEDTAEPGEVALLLTLLPDVDDRLDETDEGSGVGAADRLGLPRDKTAEEDGGDEDGAGGADVPDEVGRRLDVEAYPMLAEESVVGVVGKLLPDRPEDCPAVGEEMVLAEEPGDEVVTMPREVPVELRLPALVLLPLVPIGFDVRAEEGAREIRDAEMMPGLELLSAADELAMPDDVDKEPVAKLADIEDSGVGRVVEE